MFNQLPAINNATHGMSLVRRLFDSRFVCAICHNMDLGPHTIKDGKHYHNACYNGEQEECPCTDTFNNSCNTCGADYS